jgi:poly(hydroxyalkanoate) depolymerase family esterase
MNRSILSLAHRTTTGTPGLSSGSIRCGGNPKPAALVAAACGLALMSAAPSARALTTVSSFGSNPASLTMDVYIPQGMPKTPQALVVALHGCTQSPSVYVDAGWDQLADDIKFYVLYPGQNTSKNNSLGCFNWGGRWKSAPNDFPTSAQALDVTDIQRGQDENESIIQMVDYMKSTYAIDASRVYVTGLSAGGAMTAVMMAAWPDVFAAGAIFAGIPYGCATNKATTTEANDCMSGSYSGSDAYLARTPQAWGDLVRKAYAGYSGPYPRVSLWQGTADTTVNPANQTMLMDQWTDVHGVSQTPTSTDTVDGFPHAVYADSTGVAVVETYKITGATHGTEIATSKPVDPAFPSGGKCGSSGEYFIDDGICSSYYAAKFFGLLGGSTTSPDGGVVDAGREEAGGVTSLDAGVSSSVDAATSTGGSTSAGGTVGGTSTVDAGRGGASLDGGLVGAGSVDAGVASAAGGGSGNQTTPTTTTLACSSRGPVGSGEGPMALLFGAVAAVATAARRRRTRSGR